MLNLIAFPGDPLTAATFLPARALARGTVPWVPLSPGKAFKPLRFLRDDRGFVELLRLEPGETIPLHRHTGEVHAFNLEGTRELHTGEIIGPGGYVYEPVGNVDSWKVVGDAPLVVLVVVTGTVEYLDAAGHVTHRYTAKALHDLYCGHCIANGIAPRDLYD
ncbi:MAG TPA: cupin domain-containing protein [Rhodanobacteraceae bacterium]|nr:cupin domain-containing protein [Rhodanobacteraceae bacterium]